VLGFRGPCCVARVACWDFAVHVEIRRGMGMAMAMGMGMGIGMVWYGTVCILWDMTVFYGIIAYYCTLRYFMVLRIFCILWDILIYYGIFGPLGTALQRAGLYGPVVACALPRQPQKRCRARLFGACPPAQ
jgi:hypothetical protein